jgi:hypothetical protein
MSAGISEVKSNLVPAFIKASSPEALVLKLEENNIILKSFINYFSIQQTSSGDWIAWYYKESDLWGKIKLKKG